MVPFGPLAKPPQVVTVSVGLQGVKEEITAFGQELTVVGTNAPNLTLETIDLHLDSMIAKLETLKSSNITTNQNVLKKLDAAARGLIKLVDIETGNELNKYTKTAGDKLATKQRAQAGSERSLG